MQKPTILHNVDRNDRVAEKMQEILNPDMVTLRQLEEGKAKRRHKYPDPVLQVDGVNMTRYVDEVNGIASTKNVVDEFIDKTRDHEYGFHEYTRGDVVSAKIKSFYTGLPYSINNMYLVPGNILEFTLYIIITMVINKEKKVDLPLEEQHRLEKLLVACKDFMRSRTFGFLSIDPEDRYIIVKQEIIFNYMIGMI